MTRHVRILAALVALVTLTAAIKSVLDDRYARRDTVERVLDFLCETRPNARACKS